MASSKLKAPRKYESAYRLYGARKDTKTVNYAQGRPRKIEGESMVVGDELLASMTRVGQGGVYFLPVDDIIARKGWSIYKDMMHDDQVRICLQFKKVLIYGRTWELKPYDDSAEAKAQAEFAEWALKEINFKSVMREALSALEFGFSVGEIVWDRKDYEGKQVICFKKIAHRDPSTLKIGMDRHGNLTGITQEVAGLTVPLPMEKLWIYSHDKRFGNPYGTSVLRAAYRSWWAKKYIINFWNVFMERMGTPLTKMTYPQGASEDLKTTLKRILTNLSSKTELLVPEGVQIDLIEASRSGNAGYMEALQFHNDSIARAILMASLMGTGAEDKVGGNGPSQSSLHLRILFKMADEITQDVTRTFHEQALKQLIDMNFEKPMYPEFVWQDYGQFEGMKVADTIRLLHSAGILDLSQEDVNYARSVLGLPIRTEEDDEDEVIRPPAPPPPGNAGAPPPAAGQGNERAKKGGDTSTPEENSEFLVVEQMSESTD